MLPLAYKLLSLILSVTENTLGLQKTDSNSKKATIIVMKLFTFKTYLRLTTTIDAFYF